MNSALPYVSSLLLLLLLVAEKWQHDRIVTKLLDRLMMKEGLEPLTEKTEPKTVEKHVMSKEAMLAQAGAVRLRNPFAELVPKGTK